MGAEGEEEEKCLIFILENINNNKNIYNKAVEWRGMDVHNTLVSPEQGREAILHFSQLDRRSESQLDRHLK